MSVCLSVGCLSVCLVVFVFVIVLVLLCLQFESQIVYRRHVTHVNSEWSLPYSSGFLSFVTRMFVHSLFVLCVIDFNDRLLVSLLYNSLFTSTFMCLIFSLESLNVLFVNKAN